MSTTLTAAPAPAQSPYSPVHVWADAQPQASRWLWLVKWLLIVPHAIVLAFLWIGFVVLSIVAFFAILVTGRYPRALFDFNVGVIRWSWRVAYYGYSALATDRYPPFTLADVPDYPAHVEVDYPEHLSRGLVLVKWWLLALPHYVVVGLLVGGGSWWVAKDDSAARFAWGGGLVGLLVLVGAVLLAVTGQYPRPLYDLVLGLNRWVLRVCAYAALMTDAYPPFRLDLGPDDRGHDAPRDEPSAGPHGNPHGNPHGDPHVGPSAAVTAAPTATMAASPAARAHGAGPGWTTGRIVGVVVGSILGMISLLMLTGGTAFLVMDNAMRDSSGYVTATERSVSSPGYAVAMTSIVIDSAPGAAALPHRMLGDVRIRVTSSGDTPVFVGVAPTSAVNQYLGGVARTVHESGWADSRDIAGRAPAQAPTALGIWDVSRAGTGTQELSWTARSGDWAFVLMNADGSADVRAQVSVGAELPWLETIGVSVLIGGLVLLAGGVLLVAISTHRASNHYSAPHPSQANHGP